MSVIKDETVLLIGAGVSSFIPADLSAKALPTGQDIVTGVLKRLFQNLFISKDANGVLTDGDKIFTRIVNETPFEQILEHYPDADRLKDIFADFFNVSDFNAIHGVIADEISAGQVKAIITTNYDRCLEGVLEARQIAYSAIADEWAARSAFNVFKIHGSADHRNSIVATLATEYCLPDWKFDLLASLVKDKNLVLLGFSGRDFDICPAIFSPKVSPRSVTWVEPSQKPSINFRTAIDRHLAVEVKMPFQEALRRSNSDTRLDNVTWSQADPKELIDDIFKQLTPPEIRRWRFRLLNALALPRYMAAELAEARAYGGIKEAELHLWEADLAEREGRYADSEKYLRRAINTLDTSATGSKRDAYAIKLVLAGRQYTARQTGPFLKALIDVSFSRFAWIYRADILYLYGLLAKAIYVRSRVKIVRELAQRIGRIVLNASAAKSYDDGKWQNVYLRQVQAQDLGVELELRGRGASHLLNLATAGFQHLNNYVGQISADRKHNPQRFADVEHTKQVVKELEWLGLYPEIWKIADEAFSATWRSNKAAAESILDLALSRLASGQISAGERVTIRQNIERHRRELRGGDP